MKYTTSITNIQADGTEIIRGYPLTELATQQSFAEVIFLLTRGVLPTVNEAKMFNTILVMAIDHGPGTVSAQNARVAASSKTSIQAAVASGILAMGDRHGGAVGNAAQFFKEHKNVNDVSVLVTKLKEQNIRLPGFGHAVLSVDQRSKALFAMARDTHSFGEHCAFALALEKALQELSSKPVPLNIDGAMAAILLDLDFRPEITTGIFIIARVPGLVAQVAEEMENDVGLRRIASDSIEYTGSNTKV